MKSILTIGFKELKAWFQSPIALIFLGVFLFVTLFVFFSSEKFFARNIADVRPMFEWLPILLIFLVSAITMRQWAEEKKMGTLEILLTLPLKTWHLVLGKFFAGLALVALALALTLPLPITVSIIGELDWGPVIGGYVGALFLASTYLAIGLCISSRTDNQVVSLMLTLLIGGALYLVGTELVTGFFGIDGAELVSSLGSGSRFTSIERGVIDFRDLFYYGSLAAFFLTLNVFFLEVERIDTASLPGQKRLFAWLATVVLVLANVLLGNLWLAPVTFARADLTKTGEYSISQVTIDTLNQLDEPLILTGYFSDRTHPLLTPLVPQIRDLLKEYEIYSRGAVEVSFVNPNADEAVEEEINEAYGIHSFPFAIEGRHEKSVVNSYFHILIKYGDKYEVLSFADLIDVRVEGQDVEVGLRNLEYDLTRTIKRVTQDFQSLSAIFAKMPTEARLTAYITPETLPEEYKEMPDRFRTVIRKLQEQSGGKLKFEEFDPTKEAGMQQMLYDKYRLRSIPVDLFGTRSFFMHLVLEAGDNVERILPRGEVAEGDLTRALESAIKRSVPGQLKTVGLFTEEPEAPPPNPQLPPHMQPPPPQRDYRGLEQQFGEDFQVEVVTLDDGVVPEHIDILVVGKPGEMTDVQKFGLDQYLMRGGAVIALAGRYKVDTSSRGALAVAKQDAGLSEMLQTWGVSVKDALVLDDQNASFPIPVQERKGPIVFNRVELIPYPYFPDIRKDGFAADHVAVAGLSNVTTPWASPIELNPPEGVEAKALLTSSAKAWISETGDISPNFDLHEDGFAMGTDLKQHILAATLTGQFTSYFADKDSPIWASSGEEGADSTGRTLKEALPGARLAVVASSEIVSDVILQMASGPGGEVHATNLSLVHNLIDWSVEDTDLLQIRASGAFARTLPPMTPEQSMGWEIGNYVIALLGMLLVFFIPWGLRLAVRPIRLQGAGQ
jgi:ABC-2 type transport system permease protein